MNFLRKHLIHFITSHLFNGITKDDILQVKSKDVIIYKGKELNGEQKLDLRRDAEQFGKSVIWKLLSDDAKYQANLRMFEQSTDIQGMMFGKAVLFAIDVIDKRIEQFKNL